MICIKCFTTITKENRQTYKMNLRLPYCAPCIQKHIAAQSIKKMSPAQRQTFINESKRKLEDTHSSKEDKIEARMQLRDLGLTEKEIEYITKD